METQIDKIEELLMLGRWLGPGSRYLIRYEGELTITNSSGLANWPSPRPEIIAKLDAIDCLKGPTSQKWDEIFEKLRINKAG